MAGKRPSRTKAAVLAEPNYSSDSDEGPRTKKVAADPRALKGRFSGRLKCKADEAALAAECRCLTISSPAGLFLHRLAVHTIVSRVWRLIANSHAWFKVMLGVAETRQRSSQLEAQQPRFAPQATWTAAWRHARRLWRRRRAEHAVQHRAGDRRWGRAPLPGEDSPGLCLRFPPMRAFFAWVSAERSGPEGGHGNPVL